VTAAAALPPRAASVTHAAPHVRDGLDLRGAVRCLLWAVAPCALLGVANAGYQALAAADLYGIDELPEWQLGALEALGLEAWPESAVACGVVGLMRAVPILAVAAGVGWAWTRVFARVRGRSASEALPAVVVLFALMLPPAIPLWQVAIGISFAVVLGLEVFGGTGRNVVHPALVGVALLYFAYPASFSGEGVWVGLPGVEAPPVLSAVAAGGLDAVAEAEITWLDTFLGREPGALGETSVLACLAGAALLLYAGLASWRILAGGVLGLAAAAALANAFGDPARPEVGLPIHWHLTAGGFAFGLVFVATDPVTSAGTAAGRWAYGVLIGFLVVLVRVFNPAHAEGVMMAILLANVAAPLLDHVAVRAHGLRRRRRRG
jgi:Na+-transporting NADH:ubiquinone oxidoreductase subunit B